MLMLKLVKVKLIVSMLLGSLIYKKIKKMTFRQMFQSKMYNVSQ